MTRISALRAASLCALLGLSAPLAAEDNLFVYVFKDGLVQPNVTVTVGEQQVSTDQYGRAVFDLKAAGYQVGYSQGGQPFAVTNVNLLEGVQSQVFLNLTGEGANASLDLPLAALKQDFEQSDVKKLADGPKGKLVLTVSDASNGGPVAGARLYFKGYEVEATTDEQGLATIDLPEGGYDISIVHPNYVMAVKKDIKVEANETFTDALALAKSDFVLEEYVVSAPVVEGSLASVIGAMKDSDVVGDAISSEQFTKSGDSTASGALKRVTGITIVDGKYIFIRGLGERYSTVLLNNLHIPSPEPTKRVVPLDIFPTGVIQAMDIQKTYSANLPGTFAGGTLLIKSKDIPKEDNYVSGSVSLNMSDNTGEEVQVGVDNSKGLPGLILNLSENFAPLTEEVAIGDLVLAPGVSSTEKAALNSAMVNYRSFAREKRSLDPGMNFSVSAGQSFKTGSGLKYGFAGSVYYKTDEKLTALEKNEYQHNPSTGDDLHIESGDFQVVDINEKVGGLFSFGVDDLDSHSAKYTLLLLNETTDTTNFGTKNDLIEDTYNERTFLQYEEQELVTHQFNGTSRFFQDYDFFYDEVVLDWGVEVAEASRTEPGTFEYEYKSDTDGLVVDAKKLFFLYSDLQDEVDNQRLDVTLPFVFNGRENYTQFGVFNYNKTRDLDNRRFKFEYDQTKDPSAIDDALSQENVDNGTLEVLDSYKADDFYTAEQEVTAYYVNQLISPLEDLDVTVGVRVEDSTQSLLVGQEEESHSLETSDVLPSIGATYRISENKQVRVGFASSISRPDFREFSPNRYKDPLTGYIVFGYEGLKYTTIENLDIKYEWYPSYDEFVSVGAFTKTFTDPIETVRAKADEDIETSYRNAESAESFGLELGFRKSLRGYQSWLENFYVEGNYAWIDSSISLDKDSPENANDQFIPFLTTDSRPMQGQSPYVANLKLGYDNLNTRRSAVLLFNEFGERISALGINGNPDTYEQPFRKLDFVMKWGLNDTFDEQRKKIGYTVSFKADNLLDSERVEKQGSAIATRSNPGRTFSVSFSAKF